MHNTLDGGNGVFKARYRGRRRPFMKKTTSRTPMENKDVATLRMHHGRPTEHTLVMHLIPPLENYIGFITHQFTHHNHSYTTLFVIVGTISTTILINNFNQMSNNSLLCSISSTYTRPDHSDDSVAQTQLITILHYTTSKVYSLGHDSIMWSFFNLRGIALFLEEDHKLVSLSARTVSRANDRHRSKISSKHHALIVLLVVGDCILVGLQPILVFKFKAKRPKIGEKSLLSDSVFLQVARNNVLLIVPALLYAINNYLKFIMQLYFNPATVKMVSNLKVLVIVVIRPQLVYL
ncbi:CMP-sialic acid transporter 5 [Vitis vinifera]|uniref:CMP-sialic acid transporter 5 n=1 Tax=Vitis vinifera TaxID=29760 RepID=A0A438FUX2_VITVI|nr:CMP-sialic acid transporter 5 [Vitis vinifera]